MTTLQKPYVSTLLCWWVKHRAGATDTEWENNCSFFFKKNTCLLNTQENTKRYRDRVGDRERNINFCLVYPFHSLFCPLCVITGETLFTYRLTQSLRNAVRLKPQGAFVPNCWHGGEQFAQLISDNLCRLQYNSSRRYLRLNVSLNGCLPLCQPCSTLVTCAGWNLYVLS